tara:strand:- start:7321 stop:8262 length:942 start_codon:yes stop_codon:yes gene_type:complete
MTVPTNTYETFAQIGTKEDISPVIARIDPEETPFYSNARKTSAKQKTNQWQTQALAAAAANSAIEGDDTASAAATPTVLLNNVQNIAKKVFQTSGSNSAQEAYGRSNEHTYQRLLKGVELRRDIEVTLLADTAKVAGSSGTARVCAGVPTWLTNTSHGTGGSAATGNGTNTTTNGTDRAFTLAQLKTVMTACRNDGGKPSMLMLSPGQKVNFSSFTGIAENRYMVEKGQAGALIGTVEYWLSDFGRVDVVDNPQQAVDNAFLLDPRYYEVKSLRNMVNEKLSKTGDSEKEHILCEFTLIMNAPSAHGGVFDLS